MECLEALQMKIRCRWQQMSTDLSSPIGAPLSLLPVAGLMLGSANPHCFLNRFRILHTPPALPFDRGGRHYADLFGSSKTATPSRCRCAAALQDSGLGFCEKRRPSDCWHFPSRFSSLSSSHLQPVSSRVSHQHPRDLAASIHRSSELY